MGLEEGTARSERDDVAGNEEPTAADLRMAEILADGEDASAISMRRRLSEDASDDTDELLARVSALEFLDTVVGEIGGDLPERLGSYRIIGVLGRGGMGTVFDAFDETLERVVAVKVLAPGLTADPRMRKRFRTEARASATLHHQHIVPIYGYGEAAGFLYFAMERVDGISLDKHIASARRLNRSVMEPLDAARRFAGVADALAHAHRRGILHRDVKPGNILVHPDGALALADFGLSKIAGEQSLSVSQHGGFLGTLHYAAPEQARARPVTEASDLYSFGVTLYEAVTGRLPFEADSTEAILHALLHEDPQPLRRVLQKAPRDLELVVEKLLAKEPEERYSDAEQVARDLQRVADDEPVGLRRRSVLTRAWRFARKHRAVSLVSAVAALLLLVVLVQSWQGAVQRRGARASRHDVLVTEAMSKAALEGGPLGGPSGLLGALVGAPVVGDAPSEVLSTLAQAEKQVPDSEVVRNLRTAYLEETIPAEVIGMLRSGRGLVAMRILDRLIDEAVARNTLAGRETGVGLQLYRLYFARAIAQLTAAVGDRDGAARDLIRASMMRSGAFASRLLSDFVDWRPEKGISALASRLDTLLESTPLAAAHQVAADLLRIACRPRRPLGAQLLEFDWPASTRLQLSQLADRIDGKGAKGEITDEPDDVGTTVEAGEIEDALAAAARRVAESFANESRRRDLLDGLANVLDEEVAAQSPLQSWRLVHAFLENPDPTAFERRLLALDLPGAIVLRGLDDLFSLDLPVDLIRRLSSTKDQRGFLDRFLAQVAQGPRTYAVRTRFAERVQDTALAQQYAEAWVRAEPDSAEATLALLECRLAAGGDPDRVAIEGARVLQLALDRPRAARQIRSLLDSAAAQTADATRAARLRELGGKFVGRKT